MRVSVGLLGLLASAAALPVCAAEGWQFSGAMRVRYEAISDQPRLAYNEDDQVLLARTSVQARYIQGRWRLVAELQDSRTWMADAGTPLSTNEVNPIDLTQAYVVGDFAGSLGEGSSLSVQAGRFSMSLGSRRLAASEDYRNTTNSMTGFKADWQLTGGTGGTAFLAFPVPRLPDTPADLLRNEVVFDHERLDTLWYGAQWRSAMQSKLGALEVLAVGLRDRDAPGRPTRDRDLRTVDVRLIREPAAGKWDWDLEGAMQWGHASISTAATAAPREVAANYLHLRAGYQWNMAWKPRLALDYDWASGDGSGPVSHRFDTLYGGRRGDFAPSGLYALVGRANISSPGLRVEVTPNTRLDWMATLRGLWLASPSDVFSTSTIKDPSGTAGRYAGTQWDTRLRWWVVPKRVQLEVNAVLLQHGRFLQEAPAARRESATRFVAVSVMSSF